MEISGPKTQTMCISKEHEALSIKLYGTSHRMYILGFLLGRKQLIWKSTEHMEGQGSPSNY